MHCGKPEFVDEKHKENDHPLHVAARKKSKGNMSINSRDPRTDS